MTPSTDPAAGADALAVLGLPATATGAEIVHAYRRLVRVTHPDATGRTATSPGSCSKPSGLTGVATAGQGIGRHGPSGPRITYRPSVILPAHIGRALSSLYGFRNSSAGACAPTGRAAMTATATMRRPRTLAMRLIEALLRHEVMEAGIPAPSIPAILPVVH